MNFTELKELHEKTCDGAKKTLAAKNHDYADDGDIFKNFTASQYINIQPEKGILMRIMDKISRCNTFIENGELKVTEESFDDAIEDTINYLILLKAYNKQKQENVTH